MLLDMLLDFKRQGMTAIIITHKLNEVAYVADRITVIRDGTTIETMDNSNRNIDEERIIRGMVGRELTSRYPEREHNISDEVLFEAKDWTVYHPIYTDKCVVENVSFNVRRGEVVGFSGLQGAGRTELAMSLFGKSYGSRISGREFINVVKETEAAEDYVKAMRTKTPSIQQDVGNLSGGNQQKVLLSKWLFADPDVLILDEPSRGIDVGAKYEIYCIINDMVSQGKAVIMISSELPELLGMSDRIYIMNEGKMVGELETKEATQEKIMSIILKSDKE